MVEIEEDLPCGSMPQVPRAPTCTTGEENQAMSLLRNQNESHEDRGSLDDERPRRGTFDPSF